MKKSLSFKTKFFHFSSFPSNKLFLFRQKSNLFNFAMNDRLQKNQNCFDFFLFHDVIGVPQNLILKHYVLSAICLREKGILLVRLLKFAWLKWGTIENASLRIFQAMLAGALSEIAINRIVSAF